MTSSDRVPSGLGRRPDEAALGGEAGPLGCPAGRDVADLVPQLEPLEVGVGEGPLGHQPQGSRREAPPPEAGHHAVADEPDARRTHPHHHEHSGSLARGDVDDDEARHPPAPPLPRRLGRLVPSRRLGQRLAVEAPAQ